MLHLQLFLKHLVHLQICWKSKVWNISMWTSTSLHKFEGSQEALENLLANLWKSQWMNLNFFSSGTFWLRYSTALQYSRLSIISRGLFSTVYIENWKSWWVTHGRQKLTCWLSAQTSQRRVATSNTATLITNMSMQNIKEIQIVQFSFDSPMHRTVI